jgi:hypothetical protein
MSWQIHEYFVRACCDCSSSRSHAEAEVHMGDVRAHGGLGMVGIAHSGKNQTNLKSLPKNFEVKGITLNENTNSRTPDDR